MDGIQTYQSEFLPETIIMIVTDDSPFYENLVPKFQEFGYGFLVPDKDVIVIDGEKLIDLGAKSELFKFIEAHEVAHILLGHNGPRNNNEEFEADLGAYLLLSQYGYNESLKLLVKNFKFRHGIKFNNSMLDKVKNRLPDI